MENDSTNIGLRIARYSKVSTTMAGLATKLAGEKYFGLTIEREEHAAALTQALGNLKGPLMKVGQILATIPEALPPEYATALQQLQSDAPPMGWPFVRRRMKTELGPNWQEQFAEFEKTAAAAAEALSRRFETVVTSTFIRSSSDIAVKSPSSDSFAIAVDVRAARLTDDMVNVLIQ